MRRLSWPFGRWRFGRLDDVGGRGLGGGRGILARRGELRLQLRDGALEDIELRLQGLELCLLGLELRALEIQLRLQPLAIRTSGDGFGYHGGLFYITRDQ